MLLKNKFISLLLIKFSIIDLSKKNKIKVEIIMKIIDKKLNLNDIENISFDEREVT